MAEGIPTVQKGVKVSKKGYFIRDIPVPTPRETEVLIRNEVVSSNPKGSNKTNESYNIYW